MRNWGPGHHGNNWGVGHHNVGNGMPNPPVVVVSSAPQVCHPHYHHEGLFMRLVYSTFGPRAALALHILRIIAAVLIFIGIVCVAIFVPWSPSVRPAHGIVIV
jgi:hypothetical protein